MSRRCGRPATAALSTRGLIVPSPTRFARPTRRSWGGADGITVHLREDRRHIVDRDVELLRSLVAIKLNLEMAATAEMVEIACRLETDTSMLVPEGRAEVTTEGGLDVNGQRGRLAGVVSRLKDAGTARQRVHRRRSCASQCRR